MGETASHSANHKVQITEGIKSSAGQLRRRPLASASRYPAGRLGGFGSLFGRHARRFRGALTYNCTLEVQEPQLSLLLKARTAEFVGTTARVSLLYSCQGRGMHRPVLFLFIPPV